MLNIWHRAVLNKTHFIENFHTVTTHKLDQHQTAIFQQILQAMDNRNEHYFSILEFSHISNDKARTCLQRAMIILNQYHSHLLIRRIFLITGEAGTGKSQIVLRAIEWFLKNDLKF